MDAHSTVTAEEGDRYPLGPPSFLGEYLMTYRIDIFTPKGEQLEFIHRHSYGHWVNEIRPEMTCLPDDDELELCDQWAYDTWGVSELPGPGFWGEQLVPLRYLTFPSKEAADKYFDFYRDKDYEYWAKKNNRQLRMTMCSR